MLILDEPTSGVDPIARDRFWQILIGLSRDRGVTIFVSTHFMNEAARCDRIALMDAGRVLITGTPGEIVASREASDLEDAFIRYLKEAEAARGGMPGTAEEAFATPGETAAAAQPAKKLPSSPASGGSSPTASARLLSCAGIRSACPSPCSAPHS